VAHHENLFWLRFALITYFFAEVKGLYASWRMGGIVVEITDLVIAWGMVVMVLVMIAFMSKTSADFSRLVVMTWFVVSPFGLFMARVFVRVFLREIHRVGKHSRTLAIVGANVQGGAPDRKITGRTLDGHAAFQYLRRRG
jgi:putative colanic acid biosysnthesis UDP-glucose lipid carrier transferase